MLQAKRNYAFENGLSLPTKNKQVVPQKQNSSFVEGSIVRIKLNQFLTYDSIEFETGPFLNVIIGPNGTGKSAIVCAICLGLAGKTSTLGRASDLRDFIKYGADKASIEIELFNPYDVKNYKIRREITSSNTSHWWFNDQTITLKSVEEFVGSLNIQVSNLCQFLPQEKVADFARMSQQELLENTEKSVGRANLYENHQLLKNARLKARHLEQDVSTLQKELDQEKQKNARLEQDVQSYRDRKKFLEKVKVLEMKKPWLEYGILRDQYDRAKTEKDTQSEVLKKEMKQIAPLETKQKTVKECKDNLDKTTREMAQKIQVKAKDLKEQSNLMLSANDKIDEAKGEFESKVKEEEAREKRLNDLKEQLKALENSLSQMEKSDVDVISGQLEKVSEDLREVSHQMTSVQLSGERLQREISDITTEIRDFEVQIKGIQDVNNRRLETLRHLHAHTYEAVIWLRANKNIFKSTIYEPMIISLNVTNPADAKLVEAHISFNDLRSFVCEDADDLDLFMKHVRQDLKLRVNIVKAPAKPVSSFQPRHPISYYKKFGFEHYLQSLFTCQEPVMRFLCLQYNVHQIPVGSNAIQNNLEWITKECPEVTNFYTPDVQYSMKQSKYSKNVSSRNTALKEPRALVVSMNEEKEQELKEALKAAGEQKKIRENEYKIQQKKSEDLVLQINGLREQKRNLVKQKDERKSLRNQITTKEQRIQQILKERFNLTDEKKKLHQQLKKIIGDKLESLQKMKKISADCVNMAKERVEKSLLLVECVQEFTSLDTQLRNASQRYEGLKREVEHLKQHVAELKQQAREKLIEAKRLAGIGMNDQLEEELTGRGIWQEFSNAPIRLDELENEIHSMQARAEVMFHVDEQVVRDFENREREIKNLEAKFQEMECKRQAHQEDITQAKSQWLQPLNELIQEINTNFSHFFSCLNCCGEVSLSEPENPEDYEKYGVFIKVKFRDNETLQELTAHRQSGGERSVATVLYIMSLQELTKCPFRCVDEINQGMDPKNERKIFQLVVQTVCKKSTSQYFLLTPKLLPDLEYDNNMTVLCIYNGMQMMEHKSWRLGKFIEGRKRIS